jgi:hypothetical protein
MRDLPEVQGFWLEAKLDKYWTSEGSFGTKNVMTLGRYERAPLSPKEQALADANARGHQMSQWTRSGSSGESAACMKCGDEMHWVESAWGKGRADGRASYDRKCSGDASRYATNARKRGAFLDGPRGTGAELKRLRRMQDLVAQQIETAHRQGNTAALESLQLKERDLQERVDRLAFPEHTPNAQRARLTVTSAQMSIVQIHCDDPAHDDERQDWWPTQVTATIIEFPADRAEDVARLLTEISNSESDDPGGEPGAWRAATALASKVRKSQLTPNASHYVWVLNHNGTPKDEGPYGPKDLDSAKTFARIAATKGAHDRAVSRGLDPQAPSFEIVRVYERGTGKRVQ